MNMIAHLLQHIRETTNITLLGFWMGALFALMIIICYVTYLFIQGYKFVGYSK